MEWEVGTRDQVIKREETKVLKVKGEMKTSFISESFLFKLSTYKLCTYKTFRTRNGCLNIVILI
jgi:hypothetical protein